MNDTSKTDIGSEIERLVNARYSLLMLETYEEGRAIEMLNIIAEKLGMLLVTWSITQGLRTVDEEPYADETSRDLLKAFDIIEGKKEKIIVVFKDVHPYLQPNYTMASMISRRIRDLASTLKYGDDKHIKTMVLMSPKLCLPDELQKVVTVLSMPLPSKKEIDLVLSNLILTQERNAITNEDKKDVKEIDKELSENGFRDKVLTACLGLTGEEAENVLAKSIVATHRIDPAIIVSEKEQIIKKNGILEYIRQAEGLDSIGGLDELKSWIRKAKKRNSKEAEAFGLTLPRGVLLIGYAGTGKSISTKAIAQELGVPLLRMDMSSISSKWYGETSNKLKQGLNLADAVSPCVLMLDEIEKMFSTGEGGGQAQGHEETMRALSVLLTHMEESPYPVVYVATCNTPYNLRPEMMQRFGKIYFVGLPNEEERTEIIKIQLGKVKRNPDNFDIQAIVEVTEGFVGREIRTIVQEAMATAFDEGAKDVTTEHIVFEANKLIPMSRQKKEEFDKLREYAEHNCVFATSPKKIVKETKKTRNIRVQPVEKTD